MMRAQPVFMMRAYSPEDMPYPWSMSGREGVWSPSHVRVLSPRINPRQPCTGPVYDQPGLGNAFCPDVMEEIVTDYLRRDLNEVRRQNGDCGGSNRCPCAPATMRKVDCCGDSNKHGTRPKCSPVTNAARCQKKSCQCSGSGGSSGPQATNGAHSANQRGPSTRASPDNIRRQPQPETVSLDTLMEHVFGEIFGPTSRDESRPADDGAATKPDSGDTKPDSAATKPDSGDTKPDSGDKRPETKTTGDSNMKKQMKGTSVGEGKTGEPKTENRSSNKSDKSQSETNTGEDLRNSGVMSLHDVLDIMFSDLLGSQRRESSDERRQDDTKTTPSSVPKPANMDSKSQSSNPGVGESSVHDQPQALDLKPKSEEAASNTNDGSEVTDDATSQAPLDKSVDDYQNDNSETDDEHSEYDMVEGADELTNTSLAGSVNDTDAVHNKGPTLDDHDNYSDDGDEDEVFNESHQDAKSVTGTSVSQDVLSHDSVEPKAADLVPKQFRMSFDLSGFSPDDIRVTVADDKLTVKASRETEENGLTSEHSTQRSLTLPPGVDAESLRCRLDDDCHMTVSAYYMQNNKGQKLLPIEKVIEN